MFPAEIVMSAVGPTVPVALNVTDRDPEVAVNAFAPAVLPSVHPPTAAMPEASVTTVAPVIVPPPEVTLNVTVAPGNGSPFWSCTTTAGAGDTDVPTTAEIVVAELAVIVVATNGSDVFSLQAA